MADEFKVHRLNADGLAKAEKLAEVFDTCLGMVKMILNSVPSREQSLVVTKLQEASYWAKRAMAMQPGNQEGANPHSFTLPEDEGEDPIPYCTACGARQNEARATASCPGPKVGG